MKYKNILITGSSGMVGSSLRPYLGGMGYQTHSWRSTTMNLLKEQDAWDMVRSSKPDAVIHLAALCGGIGLNRQRPGDLCYQNMQMGINLLNAVLRYNKENKKSLKVINLSTICAYPAVPPRIPFVEEDLWMGYPEISNSKYSSAKKAVMELGNAYREQYGLNFVTLMPTNVYGEFDQFKDGATNHVVPALIVKFCDAVKNNENVVKCWGTGRATREFLHVSDLCRAIQLALEYYDGDEPINIKGGEEASILSLAEEVARATGYKGEIVWDTSKPDGQPKRVLDGTKARTYFGYRPTIDLRTGLARTVKWYKENYL